METKYKIVRYYFEGREPQVIRRNVTKDAAMEWCSDRETSSKTATSPRALAYTEINGEWFDGWTEDSNDSEGEY